MGAKRMTVPFTLIEGDTLPLDAAAGSAIFLNDLLGEISGMQFKCPCGCGKAGYVYIQPDKAPRRGKNQWTMKGTVRSPTLRPSVHNTGFPCRWHGWLTDGVWRSVGEN